MNQHSAVISRLSQRALADIEGLDPNKHGFCRACDKDPMETIPGSFSTISQHLFVATHIPAAKWTSLASEIAGLTDLSAKLKKTPDCRVTAYYDPAIKEGEVRRFFFDCVAAGKVEAKRFDGGDATALPWEAKSGTIASPSDRQFTIFVCAHKIRDGRCGYCGPAIIDLLQQELVKKGGADKVEVFACSHVGGHTYAGNVLVYGKTSGVCYGCFCPSDVETLVDSMLSEANNGETPANLQPKVRGHLNYIPPTDKPEAAAKAEVATA